MSTLNYTHESLSGSISQAEQLSLALMMLLDQPLDLEQLRTCVPPLLARLNDELQDISLAHRLLQHQGGMGEAPMLSAVELSSL